MILHIVFALALLSPKGFAALPLARALQQAVSLSPDVAQAREHVNENAALLAAARGAGAPAVFGSYAQAPQAGAGNNTITQRLFTFGGQVVLGDYLSRTPAVQQAVFALSQAQFDLLAAQRNERVKVTGEYYAALKAAAAADLRRQDAAGATSDLRSAQIRYRAGDAPRLDVVRAQVALANAQAALDSANVDRQNAYEQLLVETGVAASALSGFAPSALKPPPALDAATAVARALAMRSDFSSAQQAVNVETAAVALAERGSFPSVTLNAGYTRGVDSGIAVQGPSVNANVSVPVSHAAGDRAAAERARLAAVRDRVESIRRQIALDVTAALRIYDASARASAAAARARLAAQEQLRATQTGYRSGASSSLDVADARRTYVLAALNELNAVYAQAQSAATLEMELEP